MPYTPQTWSDNNPTYPASAARMTHIENGIANAAEKPGSSTADAFNLQFQFVSQKDGNDSNDGLSWGTAKATLDAAFTALPNGGAILLAPGSYSPATTLNLTGHHIIGVRAAGGVNASATIQHNFNGDLLTFISSGGTVGGGSIRQVHLSQNGNFTGAAIQATSTTAARTGTIWLNAVSISGGSNGFTRDLVLDGSADSTSGGPGIRQVFVSDCMFFGCKTAGETVLVKRGIHVFFSNCEIIQAPESGVQQGLKITDSQTEALGWNGGYILGDISSEAAGSGIWFSPVAVTGNTTWQASSANNKLLTNLGGTYTNNGTSTNEWVNGPRTQVAVTQTTNQSITNNTQTTLQWDTENKDTEGICNLGSDNTKIGVIKTPGRYLLTASIAFATNTTGRRALYLLKNGGIVAGQRQPADSTSETIISCAKQLDLAANDYVQVAVYQDSGGSLNVDATSGEYGMSAALTLQSR